MKHKRLTGKLTLGLLVGAVSVSAHSEATAEEMLVIIDRSGSMTSARDNSDGNGATRFDAAKFLAKNAVSAAATGRRYGLWTFNGSSHQEIVAVDAFATTAESRAAVLTAIDLLDPPSSSTPLAGTLCAAVDELLPFFLPPPPVGPDPRPIIELFSDGLENTTPSTNECHGPDATDHFNPEPGTWEYKVLWKARTGLPAPPPVEPPEFAYVIVNANFLFENESSVRSMSTRAFSVAGPQLMPRPPIFSPVKPVFQSPLVLSLQAEPAPIPQLVLQNPALQLQAQVDFYQMLTLETTGRYLGFEDSDHLPQLGDMTGDHCVDMDDYNLLVNNWGRQVQRKSNLDPNGDGDVDVDDYLTVLQNWGEGC